MDTPTFLYVLGEMQIDPRQRQRWKNGELADEWSQQYPRLFDTRDLELVRSQGGRGYHFIEWLAAIVLYQATGFSALVGKYEFNNHPDKQEKITDLLPPPVLKLVQNRKKRVSRAQCPDLLMYAEDRSDWFFCEVKGPGDQLSASQLAFFEQLAHVGGRRVGLLRFSFTKRGWAPNPSLPPNTYAVGRR